MRIGTLTTKSTKSLPVAAARAEALCDRRPFRSGNATKWKTAESQGDT
jgi:hypothetical protein